LLGCRSDWREEEEVRIGDERRQRGLDEEEEEEGGGAGIG
jgi:hypothetical protein